MLCSNLLPGIRSRSIALALSIGYAACTKVLPLERHITNNTTMKKVKYITLLFYMGIFSLSVSSFFYAANPKGKKYRCLHTLRGHASFVNSVAFAPDGKTLASASSDRSVKIWDRHTGACLHTLTGHTSFVDSVCYASNGKILASAGYGGSIKIWHAKHYKCLGTLLGHDSYVLNICFAPDAKTLASASGDMSVKIWNTVTYECIRTLWGHTQQVWSVCYAPDGKTLASAGDDNAIKIWNSTTGACLRTLLGHARCVRSVCFAPDGKTLASGSLDRTIKIWHTASGKTLRTLLGNVDEVHSVCYAPDMKGSHFLVPGYCKKYGRHTFIPTEIVNLISKYLLHGGRILAVAGGYRKDTDDFVRIWNTDTGQCLDKLQEHSGILSVCFTLNGTTLAVAGSDDTIRIWDLETEKTISKLHCRSYARNWKGLCFTKKTCKAVEFAVGSALIVRYSKKSSDNPYKSRLLLGTGMALIADALYGLYVQRR